MTLCMKKHEFIHIILHEQWSESVQYEQYLMRDLMQEQYSIMLHSYYLYDMLSSFFLLKKNRVATSENGL